MPESIPRLACPVVLIHGLMGFGELNLPGGSSLRYFRVLVPLLDENGIKCVSPGVPPTGSVERRAEALKRWIIKAFGDSPVHIIAHSMGGLDARHMITHLDMAGRVVSLTTLGTPHRGSSFADWVCDCGGRTRAFEFLEWSGLDMDAFRDLTRRSADSFNEKTPDVAGVRYFSVAGDKPRDRTLYLMRLSHRIIGNREGANDGLVSVDSARWGESLDVWDCDHVNLVGWSGPLERSQGFYTDPITGYCACIRRIYEVEH